MKCFIIIGRINKKLILPLIAGLIQIINSLINTFCTSPLNKRLHFDFTFTLVITIGQICVRLYPVILKISNVQKPKTKITKIKKILHYFLLIIIFASMIILDFFPNLIFSDPDIENQSSNLFPNNNPITLCSEMIFLTCISAIFLKYKYFKHHIISLIVLLLIGIFFVINFIFDELGRRFIIYLIFRISHAVLDAIYRCYQKYLMEKLYYPYWNIAFIPGVILFPIALFLFLLGLFFNNYIRIILDYLPYYIIFKIVIPLIINVIMCPLTILIVYYFPPDYILIITLLSSISETLIFCVKYKDARDFIYIPLHIIQIFFMMIYLEILELNFCGLNKNTKRNIHLRSELDQLNDQEDKISEDNNIDININYSLELEEKDNDDIKTEEEKENEQFIKS